MIPEVGSPVEARRVRDSPIREADVCTSAGPGTSPPTSDYDLMEFAGHESEAELLGLFQVSILHNVVHVAFGIAGVVASRHWNSARGYLIGGGVVYLLLWVYGLVTDLDSDANFVPLNTADNWLHFVLGSA